MLKDYEIYIFMDHALTLILKRYLIATVLRIN